MTLHPSTNPEEALWITYKRTIPTETSDSGPSWGDLRFPSYSGNTAGSASRPVTGSIESESSWGQTTTAHDALAGISHYTL